MFNWFDLMQQAQTRAGLEALTRQFQLSGDQPQKAMAAFLPAFAMGLQHAAMTNDPGRFLQSMMGGGYQNFWQAATRSFSPQAQQEGRRMLDQIFGSDEVSRRVAHQAADYAGISGDTMQQLLPLLAGILAGGMSQWMTAQAQAVQNFTPQQSQPTAGASTAGIGGAGTGAGANAAANPWAELWSNWMKAASPPEKKTDKPTQPTPFDDMMAAFMPPPAPKPSPEPSPAPSAQPESPSSSWEQMMEQGREMQANYLTSLQSIFEEAWKIDPKKS